jgi:hypothetical protein
MGVGVCLPADETHGLQPIVSSWRRSWVTTWKLSTTNQQ